MRHYREKSTLCCSFRDRVWGMMDGPQPATPTFPHLLASFHHLEKLVVAAEALTYRLPNCDSLVDRLLRDSAGSPPPRGERLRDVVGTWGGQGWGMKVGLVMGRSR